jgi:hypothetical protein
MGLDSRVSISIARETDIFYDIIPALIMLENASETANIFLC